MNQPTVNSSHGNTLSVPAASNSPALSDKREGTIAGDSVKPSPKAKAQRKPKASIKASAASPPAKNQNRCRHFTANGRRCRLAILDKASGLCFRHVAREFLPSDEDLSPAFTGLLSGFQSASRIHAFLTETAVLLVQNRISTRRAVALAYISQLLLRTLPAIEHQEKPDEDDNRIIVDIDCAATRHWPEAQSSPPGKRTPDEAGSRRSS